MGLWKSGDSALARATFPLRHPAKSLERRQSYWRFRSLLAKELRRFVPGFIKTRVKAVAERRQYRPAEMSARQARCEVTCRAQGSDGNYIADAAY
jgi:hypothetical protein